MKTTKEQQEKWRSSGGHWPIRASEIIGVLDDLETLEKLIAEYSTPEYSRLQAEREAHAATKAELDRMQRLAKLNAAEGRDLLSDLAISKSTAEAFAEHLGFLGAELATVKANWCDALDQRDTERMGHEETKAELAECQRLAKLNAAEGQDLLEELERVRSELKRAQDCYFKLNDEISQICGKALGYPWIKDDKENFPDADESHGVSVGEHVAESIAEELAEKFAAVKQSLKTAERDRDRWKAMTLRRWTVGVYGSGEYRVCKWNGKAIATGPTLDGALDAAFAVKPLEAK